jgi:hypothetical protein
LNAWLDTTEALRKATTDAVGVAHPTKLSSEWIRSSANHVRKNVDNSVETGKKFRRLIALFVLGDPDSKKETGAVQAWKASSPELSR